VIQCHGHFPHIDPRLCQESQLRPSVGRAPARARHLPKFVPKFGGHSPTCDLKLSGSWRDLRIQPDPEVVTRSREQVRIFWLWKFGPKLHVVVHVSRRARVVSSRSRRSFSESIPTRLITPNTGNAVLLLNSRSSLKLWRSYTRTWAISSHSTCRYSAKCLEVLCL
jgi:hypothetical protein